MQNKRKELASSPAAAEAVARFYANQETAEDIDMLKQAFGGASMQTMMERRAESTPGAAAAAAVAAAEAAVDAAEEAEEEAAQEEQEEEVVDAQEEDEIAVIADDLGMSDVVKEEYKSLLDLLDVTPEELASEDAAAASTSAAAAAATAVPAAPTDAAAKVKVKSARNLALPRSVD